VAAGVPSSCHHRPHPLRSQALASTGSARPRLPEGTPIDGDGGAKSSFAWAQAYKIFRPNLTGSPATRGVRNTRSANLAWPRSTHVPLSPSSASQLRQSLPAPRVVGTLGSFWPCGSPEEPGEEDMPWPKGFGFGVLPLNATTPRRSRVTAQVVRAPYSLISLCSASPHRSLDSGSQYRRV